MIYVNILGNQTYLLAFKLSILLYYLVNISKSFSTCLSHLAYIIEFPIQAWINDQEIISYSTSKLVQAKKICTIFNGKNIDTCPHMSFTNNCNYTSTHHVLQRFNKNNKLTYTHEYTNYYFQKIDITLCAPPLIVFKCNMLICHLAKCNFKL